MVLYSMGWMKKFYLHPPHIFFFKNIDVLYIKSSEEQEEVYVRCHLSDEIEQCCIRCNESFTAETDGVSKHRIISKNTKQRIAH